MALVWNSESRDNYEAGKQATAGLTVDSDSRAWVVLREGDDGSSGNSVSFVPGGRKGARSRVSFRWSSRF